MSNFIALRDAVNKQFEKMCATNSLFVVGTEYKDEIWDTYC